jgi:hypothetical protein
MNTQTSPGQRYGRWLTLSHHEGSYWLCRCDCGTTKPVNGSNLRSGASKSCGCRGYKHGKTGSPEHKAWRHMRYRCHDPKHAAYHYYGERGISVCARWRHSFSNFYEDMGPRPSPKHSLDRIDNDGDYAPENCRWATSQAQGRNRRSAKPITFRGKTLPRREWSRITGIPMTTLSRRLRRGWSVHDALTVQPDQRYNTAGRG